MGAGSQEEIKACEEKKKGTVVALILSDITELARDNQHPNPGGPPLAVLSTPTLCHVHFYFQSKMA